MVPPMGSCMGPNHDRHHHGVTLALINPMDAFDLWLAIDGHRDPAERSVFRVLGMSNPPSF